MKVGSLDRPGQLSWLGARWTSVGMISLIISGQINAGEMRIHSLSTVNCSHIALKCCTNRLMFLEVGAVGSESIGKKNLW